MKSFGIHSLILATLLLQACVVDLGDHHRHHHHHDRPSGQRGHWGADCSADFHCKDGLVCFSGVCEPERVGIYVHGALVAPGRADGMEWDAPYAVPHSTWIELGNARRGGVDALFRFMDSVARAGYSAPDVFGFAYMAVDGRWDDRLTISLGPTRRDSFEAIWTRPAGWTDVPFHEDLWIAVDLFDEDRDGDESIGLVEIDAWGLREALHLGGVVWFDAFDATEGQLLLLGIEMVSESW